MARLGPSSVLGLTLFPTLAGCTVDLAQELPSWNQATYRFQSDAVSTEVYLVVLDDGSTPAAERPRRDVRRALRSNFTEHWQQAGLGPCTEHPIDWCAVVVLPSSPRESRLVGPETHADLCVQWADAPATSVEALADRIVAVTEEHLASGLSPYRPLEAATYALDLARGRRPPTTTAEAKLRELGLTPYLGALKTLLATSRDDASPGEASDYALPPPNEGAPWVSFLALSPREGPACRGDLPSAPRLDAALPPHDGRIDWPCARDGSSPDGPRLWEPWVDTSRHCFHRPVRRDAAGTPLCYAEVVLYDPEALCEPARGWTTPGGAVLRPVPRSGPFGEEYVCELRPLIGEARVRCETEPTPSVCQSGYCIPESPALTSTCPAGEHGILRLQGGAAPHPGRIELTCDFE